MPDPFNHEIKFTRRDDGPDPAREAAQAREDERRKELILTVNPLHDAQRLAGIARAMRRARDADAALNLLCESIAYGAFADEKWTEFRHRLALQPHLFVAAVMLGKPPQANDYRPACSTLADLIQEDAQRSTDSAPPGWLRVNEAAADYDLRPDEISKLCDSNPPKVESRGKGRDRRVNPASLRTFLRKRTGLED